jgi:purine catabolism regulator
MLTVRDIATMPGLELAVAAGREGLDSPVSWLHVSELVDPTEFLEGGELLLTTGLGVGELETTQRAYVRRLAGHGLAGLGFGTGFGFPEVPAPILAEADRLGFPVLAVPYEVPFVAITKAAFTHLANEQLEQLTRALGVHERLADAVIRGRGLQALLAVVCNHLDCSLALVDEHGRVVAERHGRRKTSFEGRSSSRSWPAARWRPSGRPARGARSGSTTASSSTTARPRSRSSSPAAAR